MYPIYLAILDDRHIDIQIQPFFNVKDALEQIQKWQDDYKDLPYDIEWKTEDIKGWEYYITGGDDLPSMRIEKKELR